MQVVAKQKPLKKRTEYRKIALKTCDSDNNLIPYKSKRAIGAFKRVLCDFGFFKFLRQGIYFFVSMNAGAAVGRLVFVREKNFNVTITRSNLCL